METWFEVKIRYERMMPNGKEKKVTESFLIDAMSFTEAEEKIAKESAGFTYGDFKVMAIKFANYSEVWTGDRVRDEKDAHMKFFKGKIALMKIDADSVKEAGKYMRVLVEAGDIQEAKDRMAEKMKGSVVDYEIVEVREIKIIDVFKKCSKETKKEDGTE